MSTCSNCTTRSEGAAGGNQRRRALGEVVPALTRAREQGKTRFIGFTAIGETASLHRLIASDAFDTAQVPYNALNPSPAEAIPAAYPAQDYGRILDLPRSTASAPSASACSRAARSRGARSAIRSGCRGRADRLGRELCGRRRARAAARADGARGPCRQA